MSFLFLLVVLLLLVIKVTIVLHAHHHMKYSLEFLPIFVFFLLMFTGYTWFLSYIASEKRNFKTSTDQYLSPGVYVGPEFICYIAKTGMVTFIPRDSVEHWSEAIVMDASKSEDRPTCLTLVTLKEACVPNKLLIGTTHTTPPFAIRKIMKEWLIPHKKLTKTLKVPYITEITPYPPRD
ncbi:hypothetical protein KKF84_11230 [Myxococcota bacterium]|nr:hypothetical protein [Myxococcota bacterium]